MRIHLKLILLLLIPFSAISQKKLQSPAEFLGYKLGTKFTYHHRMVDYFRYLDNELENMQINSYGQTYEGRPLITAVISSAENIKTWSRSEKTISKKQVCWQAKHKKAVL
jgi:hypothetical protein